jgi:hypothetical protein
MRDEGVFLSGVHRRVLEEILEIQGVLPEHILFLQPSKGKAIVGLRDNPPTVDDPVRLFMSVTTDLPTVRYEAEIVGWDDKRNIERTRRNAIERLLWTLQPGEGGLYDASQSETGESVNLLNVRRLQRIAEPFTVERLIKTFGGDGVSPNRSQAGGWTYVRSEPSDTPAA